jgi:AcrR family transcriptional regulator
MPRKSTEDSRQHILDAAFHLLMTDGLPAFTLDALAKRVGLSKAGVLHHFPDKDAVAAAMMLREVERFNQRIQAFTQADKARRGRFVRAYLRASIELARATDHACFARFYEIAWSMPAVLAAVQPVLLKLCHEWYGRDGADPVDTRVVIHAIDGCMLDIAMGLSQLDDPIVQATLTRLDALSRKGACA